MLLANSMTLTPVSGSMDLPPTRLCGAVGRASLRTARNTKRPHAATPPHDAQDAQHAPGRPLVLDPPPPPSPPPPLERRPAPWAAQPYGWEFPDEATLPVRRQCAVRNCARERRSEAVRAPAPARSPRARRPRSPSPVPRSAPWLPQGSARRPPAHVVADPGGGNLW